LIVVLERAKELGIGAVERKWKGLQYIWSCSSRFWEACYACNSLPGAGSSKHLGKEFLFGVQEHFR